MKGQFIYAETLKRVRQDDSPQKVSKNVTKIRRIVARDMILVLDKSSQEKLPSSVLPLSESWETEQISRAKSS